jgi:hypothetical protein
MPYRTIWEANGLIWEFYGLVTAREIESANDEFYRDLRSDTAKYQIIDTRRVTDIEWSETDIKITAAYDIGATHTIEKLKVVLVATNQTVIEKMEKYTEISRQLESSWEFASFRTMEEAKNWVEA